MLFPALPGAGNAEFLYSSSSLPAALIPRFPLLWGIGHIVFFSHPCRPRSSYGFLLLLSGGATISFGGCLNPNHSSVNAFHSILLVVKTFPTHTIYFLVGPWLKQYLTIKNALWSQAWYILFLWSGRPQPLKNPSAQEYSEWEYFVII